jgi:multidrug efflux pump subunit AcrA (membrane-fusion protein)
MVAGVLAAVVAVGAEQAWHGADVPSAPPPALPRVAISTPPQDTVSGTAGFLGQFSGVDAVELRAQVDGTLTAIDFQDGQIVHKGDPLFVIDPRPFQIRLEQAIAQLQTAQARKALAEAELWRAQQLKRTEFGTAENVDQRSLRYGTMVRISRAECL